MAILENGKEWPQWYRALVVARWHKTPPLLPREQIECPGKIYANQRLNGSDIIISMESLEEFGNDTTMVYTTLQLDNIAKVAGDYAFRQRTEHTPLGA